MNRRCLRLSVVFSRQVVCLGVLGILLGVLSPASAAAEEMAVLITSPEPGIAVFGEVVIRAEVQGRSHTEIDEVQFFVDGQFVGRAARPPWRWSHDVGEENRAHRFEVVAVAEDGERASALLVSREIHVDLEVEAPLRQLYVTVTRKGERVADLGRERFRVVDDGEVQEIVTFEGGDVPLTAVVLVDASDSMHGERLKAALAGADQMFRRLGRLDRAKLILFSDHVVHATPFTSFAEVLRAGLRGVEARGGSAIDDHLYLALHELEEEQGRRVVVLLSDGIDVSSFLRMEEVLELSRRSQSMLYWLRPGRSREDHLIFSTWRGADAHREELENLDRMVRETGGRVVPVKFSQVGAAFDRIMDELRDQYVLGYYPTTRRGDGSWHEVRVEVELRGAEVRAREGYVDE